MIAKELIPSNSFKIFLSEDNLHPTIYTCTSICHKNSHTQVNCTFKGVQNGEEFTGHTLFEGETKVKKV